MSKFNEMKEKMATECAKLEDQSLDEQERINKVVIITAEVSYQLE